MLAPAETLRRVIITLPLAPASVSDPLPFRFRLLTAKIEEETPHPLELLCRSRHHTSLCYHVVRGSPVRSRVVPRTVRVFLQP